MEAVETVKATPIPSVKVPKRTPKDQSENDQKGSEALRELWPMIQQHRAAFPKGGIDLAERAAAMGASGAAVLANHRAKLAAWTAALDGLCARLRTIARQYPGGTVKLGTPEERDTFGAAAILDAMTGRTARGLSILRSRKTSVIG